MIMELAPHYDFDIGDDGDLRQCTCKVGYEGEGSTVYQSHA